MKLIEFLNDFFSDLNKTFSLGIDQKKILMFDTHFADIKAKYEKYIEKYTQDFDFDSNFNLKFNSEKLIDNFIPAMIGTIVFMYNFMRNPESENYIKESTVILLQNFEEFLLFQPYFDESCYNFFNMLFEQVCENNPSKLGELINMHNIYFKDEFPINKKVEHLNIVTAVQEYYNNLWDKLTLKDAFDPVNYNFIQRLIKSDKEKQRKYFDDWFLKFAQIIENYYKICLFTCCRVNALSKNTLSNRYDNLSKSLIKFASVLWNISSKYYKFTEINRIRIMRNGIDHSNVEFYMDGEWETYQFCFIDQNDQVKRTVNEFIIDYFKLIKFVFTLDLVCKFFELKIEHPNKTLSEIFIEGFEKEFPKYLEELRKTPELKYEDFKNKITKNCDN